MSFPVPQNEAQRLEALNRYALLDSASEQAFDDFTQLASYICGTPIALITLVDHDRQWFKAKVGFSVSQTPRDLAFCAHTIMTDQLLMVEDATADQRFANNPLVTSDPNIRFYAGAPLVDSNGFGLGSLCVIDRTPRRLEEPQQKALTALARQVVAQFELRRLSSELATALREVKTLHGLLPICAHCKSIRNDQGYWKKVEHYFATHTALRLSHGICPECLKIHHPEVYEDMAEEGRG